MKNCYERIDQIFNIDDHLYIDRVVIRGCKWNGEYDVEILYYQVRANYVMECTYREHVVCKRVSTINKRLAANGLKCKMV